MEYTFTLRYQLPPDAVVPDALVERLGEAGCDDAVVGIGQPGRLALEFTREAEGAEAAIVRAHEDVRRAVRSARLIEAGPDLVGLTDVARLVGVTRQNMRKLMLAHGHTFPPAVHTGSVSIWHLADVLEWLQGRGGYAVAAEEIDVARSTQQIKIALVMRRLSPTSKRTLSALVA